MRKPPLRHLSAKLNRSVYIPIGLASEEIHERPAGRHQEGPQVRPGARRRARGLHGATGSRAPASTTSPARRRVQGDALQLFPRQAPAVHGGRQRANASRQAEAAITQIQMARRRARGAVQRRLAPGALLPVGFRPPDLPHRRRRKRTLPRNRPRLLRLRPDDGPQCAWSQYLTDRRSPPVRCASTTSTSPPTSSPNCARPRCTPR